MSRPIDEPGKDYVPEKFDVAEVEPESDDDLGEIIDLKGARWPQPYQFIVQSVGIYLLILLCLGYAFACKDSGLVRYVLAVGGSLFLGVGVTSGKVRDKIKRRLQSYSGFL